MLANMRRLFSELHDIQLSDSRGGQRVTLPAIGVVVQVRFRTSQHCADHVPSQHFDAGF
jgi:hypothetical protein